VHVPAAWRKLGSISLGQLPYDQFSVIAVLYMIGSRGICRASGGLVDLRIRINQRGKRVVEAKGGHGTAAGLTYTIIVNIAMHAYTTWTKLVTSTKIHLAAV